jgi:hypothetical protein
MNEYSLSQDSSTKMALNIPNTIDIPRLNNDLKICQELLNELLLNISQPARFTDILIDQIDKRNNALWRNTSLFVPASSLLECLQTAPNRLLGARRFRPLKPGIVVGPSPEDGESYSLIHVTLAVLFFHRVSVSDTEYEFDLSGPSIHEDMFRFSSHTHSVLSS